ncbi:MAG: nucleoside monophosphate kinase [Endomicrobium sp.]|jgi:adenylate kinase|nr:nucleoside monophosphate kinase [Endomicrobium sp.]
MIKCFILLGPPGSGKGTQANKIIKKFNFLYLSTGDILRNAEKYDENIRNILKKGKLIPDSLIIKLITEYIKKNNIENGILFDGFPRTINQAKTLDLILSKNNAKISIIFIISLNLKETILRIKSRRVCSICGTNYSIEHNKSTDKCKICHGKLFQRNDDENEKVIINRFLIYEKQIKPILLYYKKSNFLVNINGLEKEEEIFKQITKNIIKRN